MDFLKFTSFPPHQMQQTQRTASWDVTRRPKPLQNTKSFSRLESPPRTPTGRTRASTIQGTIPELEYAQSAALPPVQGDVVGSIFSTVDDGDPLTASPPSELTSPAMKQPETFEELPIEIRSLTER
jgi:hypothetical protein